ncbi:MAG: hypothetical protein A2086_13385 [Spirochaetes bacterium GWD1_27_9]|nr:MAG: hypothetical protein A2Z98_02140 [Spirochaetes bacterium GWB1_27_13]OHD39899.1 MAG: hypothetical protein A2086_13385 [Spirochaetes bacterium GWD1_27_9]
MKVLIKTFFILLLLIFSVGASVIFFMNKQTGNIPVTGVEFEIKRGDSSHSIAKKLYQNGYINSEIFFVILTKVLRLDSKIKSGWLLLESDSSTMDILKKIVSGKFITVSFTIPEGSTVAQIKNILIKNKVVPKEDIEEFLSLPNYPVLIGLPSGYKTAEGFLFPETYKVFKGSSVESVFKTMVNLFYNKVESIYPDYKNLSKKDFYRKIVLASIIEREVKNPEEAAIVAGVFENRIKKNMKLQSCATVQYILDKPKERLLENDLLIDNPYNTYLYLGLPPTPISAAGLNSLRASFYPESHNYLFFVVKDPERGTHHFSQTYEEHLLAQKKYKAIKGFY